MSGAGSRPPGEAGRRQFIDSVGEQLDRYSDVVHRKAWAALLATV
jgi:hypothetical protein